MVVVDAGPLLSVLSVTQQLQLSGAGPCAEKFAVAATNPFYILTLFALGNFGSQGSLGVAIDFW